MTGPFGDFDPELAEFEEVVDILRLGPSMVADETPKPEIWVAIEAGVKGDQTGMSGLRAVPEPAGLKSPSTEEAYRLSSGKLSAILVGIAAAVLLVALPMGMALKSSRKNVELAAELDSLAGSTGSAKAEVSGDELKLELASAQSQVAEDEFLELWLLELDGEELVDLKSLGKVENDESAYAIPEDLDLGQFSVVDVSVEPDDGVEAHSGNSVLRGELDRA